VIDLATDLPLRERLRWAIEVVVRANGTHGANDTTGGAHELEGATVVRRPRPSAGTLVALAAVAAVVVLICYVAWAVLAGERLVLGDASGNPGRDARRELVRDLRAPEPPDSTPPALGTATTSPAETSRPAATATGRRPAALDGSLVAVVVMASAIAAGLAVQRAILRRSRRGAGGRVDEVPSIELGDEDEADVGEGVVEPQESETTTEPPDGDLGPEHSDAPEGTDAAQTVATAPRTRDGEREEVAGPRVVLYDRRMHRRVALRTPARLQWLAHDVACAAETLSIWEVHCLVATSATDQVPRVGTTVRVTIAVDGALVPLGATVTHARSRQDGHVVCMRFDPLDEVHREFLLAFIADAADAEDAP
jgi:hypothetical protein